MLAADDWQNVLDEIQHLVLVEPQYVINQQTKILQSTIVLLLQQDHCETLVTMDINSKLERRRFYMMHTFDFAKIFWAK